jgi:multiple sugar transport system permease protein
MPDARKALKTVRVVLLLIPVALFLVAAIFPIYWMLVVGFQKGSNLYRWPPYLTIDVSQLDVILRLFKTQPVATWLFNTLLIAVGTSLLSVGLAIPAAYSFSRFTYKLRKPFQVYLLMSQMLPATVIIVPLFVLLRSASLLNTRLGLVLVDTAISASISVWVLKAYFDTIPFELEEAGVIDGCTRLQTLIRIALPLAAPAVASSLVICFFEGWNEFTFALTFISNQALWVASVGMASWIGWLTTPVEIMMSGAVLFTAPSVVLFLVMQRQLVGGLSAGSIK